jgi:hypothetical protein
MSSALGGMTPEQTSRRAMFLCPASGAVASFGPEPYRGQVGQRTLSSSIVSCLLSMPSRCWGYSLCGPLPERVPTAWAGKIGTLGTYSKLRMLPGRTTSLAVRVRHVNGITVLYRAMLITHRSGPKLVVNAGRLPIFHSWRCSGPGFLIGTSFCRVGRRSSRTG